MHDALFRKTLRDIRFRTDTFRQRAMVRTLVREMNVDVVTQPTPVALNSPSFPIGLSAPLVIGLLNGGVEYPPGFQFLESSLARFARAGSRFVANIFGSVIRGKRNAKCVLVAYERTRRALPRGIRGRTVEIPEIGIDPNVWTLRKSVSE
jgi:hypothetical protein